MNNDKRESLETLKKQLRDGDTVYTILRSVSRSGMSRIIDLVIIKNNEPLWITWHVSKVLEYSLAKDTGLKVRGCGMDMGFHVVYSLANTLGIELRQRWL